jgi:hypothetical protein
MTLDSELETAMRATNEHSCALTEMVLAHVRDRLAKAPAATQDVSDPAWGNKLFDELWKGLEDAGFVKSRLSSGMAAFTQVLDRLTAELEAAAYAQVYKGEHYYRAALLLLSFGALEVAAEYFIRLDEEDARRSGAGAGVTFRQHPRLADLRSRLVSMQMLKAAADFHDGINSSDDRADLLVRTVLAMPRLYVASRCQTGLWRVYYIERHPSVNSCLRAIEELGVLCEGIARILHGGSTGAVNDHKMLGKDLLKNNQPCGQLGFVSDGHLFKPNEAVQEPASRKTLQDARMGIKGAMAAVVHWSRNQAMHVTDAADWYFDSSVLRDVIRVQLDFISTVANEYERQYDRLL